MKILVGVPTLNEEKTIQNVTRIIDQGLNKIHAATECIIFNIDSNSTDNTRNIFWQTPTNATKKQHCYGGVSMGKGQNLKRLLTYGSNINATCIITIDGDLTSITPSWVVNLARPILANDIDYVTPLYSRNRFEGSTTNHFAAPLLLSLFHVFVRQPIGGEFALSNKFTRYLLNQEFCSTALQYGIDIFMTMHALGGGFDVTEQRLGRKIHKPSFPNIEPMFAQVAQTAFNVGAQYGLQNGCYQELKKSTQYSGTDTFSSFPHKEKLPELLERNKCKYHRHTLAYAAVLGDIYNSVHRIMSTDQPVLRQQEWVEIMKKFVLYGLCGNREYHATLGELLTPLFITRVVEHWRNAEAMTSTEVEQSLHEQAQCIYRAINNS